MAVRGHSDVRFTDSFSSQAGGDCVGHQPACFISGDLFYEHTFGPTSNPPNRCPRRSAADDHGRRATEFHMAGSSQDSHIRPEESGGRYFRCRRQVSVSRQEIAGYITSGLQGCHSHSWSLRWLLESRVTAVSGTRHSLIPQQSITEFDEQVVKLRHELDKAVTELDRHYDELRSAARQRLGDLFDASDYPVSLIGLFAIEHDYPSVEPPDYLRQLSPELYQQECRRVQSRFDEAVQLAEQAFLDELVRLVEHITERLSGADDGKPRVFRDSAVTNLTEFFERFRTLNVRSNEQLDELVSRAQQVIGGVEPQQLRDNAVLRQRVVSQLAGVQSSLDGLLVDRPRRNILRRPQ
jgi:hypothetical protein